MITIITNNVNSLYAHYFKYTVIRNQTDFMVRMLCAENAFF